MPTRLFKAALIGLLASSCTLSLDREVGVGEVRGTVVVTKADGTTEPAAEATVRLDGSPIVVKTDAEGRFVLRRLPPGNFRLRIRHAIGADESSITTAATVKPNDGTHLGKIPIFALGAIEGTASRGTGPLLAQLVLAGDAEARTSGDGTFRFDRVVPGSRKLTIVALGPNEQPQLFDGPTVDVKPRVPTSATVTLADLAPVTEASVQTHVHTIGSDRVPGATITLVNGGASTTMNATDDGTIDVSSVPPGVYTAVVRAPGAITTTIPFVVIGGQTTIPDVVLAPDSCAQPGSTDPICAQIDRADDDADTVPNLIDNCPANANTDQADANEDGVGDVCTPVGLDFERPAPPVFDPQNPSSGSGNTLVIRGNATVGTTIRLFDNATCTGTPVEVAETDDQGAFELSIDLTQEGQQDFSTDAVDTAGNVSACSEAYRYLRDTTKPAAPVFSWTPTTPANAETIDLELTAEAGATLTLFASAGCTPGSAVDDDLVGTSGLVQFGGLPVAQNQTTRFSAQASDATGNVSDCSAPFAFVEDSIAPDLSGVILDPAHVNGAGVLLPGRSVTLDWMSAPGDVTRWEIALSRNDVCRSLVVEWRDATQGIPNELLPTTDTLDDAATYYACLQGFDAAGNQSAALASSALIVDRTPPVPPSLPSSGMNGSQLEFTWTNATDIVSGIARHEVAICEGTGCAFTTWTTWDASGRYAVTSMTPCTTYRFGVRAWDMAGLVSEERAAEASVTGVTTGSIRTLPGHASVELDWDATPGALSYEVCVGTTSDACGAGRQISVLAGTSLRVRELTAAEQYFAVRAKRGICTFDATPSVQQPQLFLVQSPIAITGSAGAQLGSSAIGVGDILGEGRGQVLVASPGLGRVELYRADFVGALSAVPGWMITGSASDRFGAAIARAGDVNRDGVMDIAIGAPGFNGSTGKVFVYSGLDRTLLWQMEGEFSGEEFGSAIDSGRFGASGSEKLGLVVGAPGGLLRNELDATPIVPDNRVGLVYVLDPSVDTAVVPIPELLPMIQGDAIAPLQRFGAVVFTLGDLEGNGSDEFVVTAPDRSTSSGIGYVVDGNNSQRRIANLGDTTSAAEFGASGAPFGDLNGDGISDFAIGDPGYSSSTGRVFIYDGRSCGTIQAGTPTCTLLGVFAGSSGTRTGTTVAAAGDVDDDGHMDLAVGAPQGLGGMGRILLLSGEGFVAGSPVRPAVLHDFGGEIPEEAAVFGVGNLVGHGIPTLLSVAPDEGAGRMRLIYANGGGSTPMGIRGSSSVTPFGVQGYQFEDVPVVLPDAPRMFDISGAGTGSPSLTAEAPDTFTGGYLVAAMGSPGGRYATLRARSPERLARDATAYVARGRRLKGLFNSRFGSLFAELPDTSGDGKHELVVGSPGTGQTGKINIVKSNGGPDTIQSGAGTSDLFGAAFAHLGDIDGDSLPDFAVGAPAADNAAEDGGRMHFFISSQSPMSTLGNVTNDRLGSSLVALDVAGDGRAELIVGSGGTGTGPGRIEAYDVTTIPPTRVAGWGLLGTAGAEVGYGIVVVDDVNGDGKRDLVVAGNTYGDGSLSVLSGANGSRIGSALTGATNAGLGRAIAIGATTRQVVVGIPGQNRVEVYDLPTTFTTWPPPRVIAAPDGHTQFGRALSSSARVLRAGGPPELVVGAASLSGDGGMVYTFDPVTGRFGRRISALSPAGDFGWAVGTWSDQTGDGIAEIVVGDPTGGTVAGSNFGTASVLYSEPSVTPPRRPTNLVVTPLANHTFHIEWTSVVGASTYDVEARELAGDWQQQPVASGANFDTTSFAPSTTVGFRVRARTASGASPWSAVVFADSMP